MSTLFEKMGKRYTEYMTLQGRNQARRVLLSQGNSVLEDLGISRELLESGVSAWPWKVAVDQPVPVAITPHITPHITPQITPHISRREQNRAIRELRALSDKDLRDIGVSRGSIVDVVKNGRPGLDAPVIPAASWSIVANQAIGTASVDLDDTAANAPLQSSAAA